MDEMTFNGIYELRVLSLVQTGLVTMPPLSPVKNTLRELYVVDNSISQVPQNYFNDFASLNTVSLAINVLHQIPNFTPLQFSLTNLQLSLNNIDTIESVLTDITFPLLKYIHLNGNNISIFDINMLSSWPVLTSLSLGDNKISKFPVIYPKDGNTTCKVDRDAICFLYFGGNPINCSVAVNEIIKRRRSIHKAYFDCRIVIFGLMSTYCKYPPHLCRRTLGTLSKYNLLRASQIWSLVCVVSTPKHYDDVIMGAMASQITSLTIVYSTVYSGADQRKHQSSASLAFVRGIHLGPVISPHKWPVMRKMFPFDDVNGGDASSERSLFSIFLCVCVCIMESGGEGMPLCAGEKYVSCAVAFVELYLIWLIHMQDIIKWFASQ